MIKYDLGLTSYEDKLEDKTIFFSRKDSWCTKCIDAQLREALSKFTVRTYILCLVLIYDVFIVQYILTQPTKVKAELNIEKVRCVLFMIQILAISMQVRTLTHIAV
jgi:hypothetical protein